MLSSGLVELLQPFGCRGLGRGRVDGFEVLGELGPGLTRCIAKAVAQQMNDAGLHQCLGPDVADADRQALQPVADEHEDVLDAPVLDLGQDLLPEFCSFSGLGVLPGPQAQDVPITVGRDADRDVDGPVDDFAVADLDHDRVHEHDRGDAVQGPVLPFDPFRRSRRP